VDPQDPDFRHPTKPVGPFYAEAQANRLRARNVPLVWVEGYGWRRVVASPRPLEVVELEAVRTLAQSGAAVIAAGGGGIPVVRKGGRLQGVDAVIDKDLTSALLAIALDAARLIILTDVRRAALHFGKPDQQDLPRLTAAEARQRLAEGHFPPGSMGPKIEAAIQFAAHTGRPAIITTPEALGEALAERDGTWVVV